ncbi:MAG: NrfD/PsrC family molybdoenzyme membrane anchor subunit [Bacteroidia bacterium]
MKDIIKPANDAEAIQMLHQFNEDLLPKKFGRIGVMWTIFLCAVIVNGLFCYVKQLRYGLSVTGMGDIVSWGIYISNFVFFVAVSLVGSLITAVLYLLNVNWRSPLTRIAEIIALANIVFAGLIIIVDMGRPDRILNMFIHGRIQSPIVWDVIVVMTYMAISFLLLYFPLVPSMAFLRDHGTGLPKWQKWMYKTFSFRWQWRPEQFAIVKRAIAILSVMIIPVALSIHTVTSWLFATTYRPGWDSTIFGPYFVAGAFMVGAAAVIAAMYVFVRFYPRYDQYITDKHFDRMGMLLVLLSLIYLYFNVNEYMVPGYKMKGEEADYLTELFIGKFAPMFWSVQILGMIVPIILLMFRRFRRPFPIFIISIFVIVGAWFKRFLIVIPTLLHPFLPMQEIPEKYKVYAPTYPEWSITFASLAGVLLVITFFVRFFPIISIWEVAEERGISHDVIYKHLNEGK